MRNDLASVNKPTRETVQESNEDVPRLLVVDDVITQRTIICRIGAQCGFDVVGAATLREAKQLIQERKFDCITIDLGLGAESGEGLIDELWDLSSLISVIVISGAAENIVRAAADKAQSLGFDAHFLMKPLELAKLRKVLEEKFQNTPIQRSLNSLTAAGR